MSLLNDVMRDLQMRGVPGMPPLAGLQPVADIPQGRQKRHMMLPLLATASVAAAIVTWGPGSDGSWVPSIVRIAGVESSHREVIAQPDVNETSKIEPVVIATGKDLRELFSIETASVDRPVSLATSAGISRSPAKSPANLDSAPIDSLKAINIPTVESRPVVESPSSPTQSRAEPPAPNEATAKTSITRREPGVEDIDGIVMRAQRALRGHDLVTAEQLFRQALAIDSSDVTIWTYLYTVLVGSHRSAAAERALQQGLKSADEPAALAKLYARMLIDRGDKKAAVGVLEMHRPAPASDTEYDAFLAALQQQTGSYAHAGETYRQLLTVNPDSGSWLIGLAMSNDSLGNRQEALAGFERALESGSLKSPLDRYAQRRIAELQAHD